MSMLLAALLLTANPTPVSPTAGVTEDDPIVIVGRRDGGTVLIVDLKEVALRCAKCQPALDKLNTLAAPYFRVRGEIQRDYQSLGETGQAHNRHIGFQQSPLALDAKADRLALIMDGFFHHQRKEIAGKRGDVSRHVADYLRALAPHVVEIAEAERQKHGASAVVNSRRAKVGKAKRIDITNEVIRQLDAKPFTLDFPILAKNGG